MKTQNKILLALSLGCAGLFAVACSDDKSDGPSNVIDGNAGSSGEAGTAGVGGAAGNGGDAQGGNAGVGGSAGNGGQAGAPADCQDTANNCFKCAPATDEQFLNHCTTAGCVPYDNSTLTQLGTGGTLPPLP
jgi:hypothetical protein